MTTMSLADARARLLQASLEETIDVLSSPEAMRQLAASRTAIEAGDVLDADELAALLAKRSRHPE